MNPPMPQAPVPFESTDIIAQLSTKAPESVQAIIGSMENLEKALELAGIDLGSITSQALEIGKSAAKGAYEQLVEMNDTARKAEAIRRGVEAIIAFLNGVKEKLVSTLTEKAKVAAEFASKAVAYGPVLATIMTIAQAAPTAKQVAEKIKQAMDIASKAKELAGKAIEAGTGITLANTPVQIAMQVAKKAAETAQEPIEADAAVDEMGETQAEAAKEQGQEIAGETDAEKLQIKGRNYANRLRADLELYRQHRRSETPKEDTIIGNWYKSTVAGLVLSSFDPMNERVSGKMDNGEDKVINAKVAELKVIRDKIAAIDPQTPDAQATIAYLDATMKQAVVVITRKKQLEAKEKAELEKLRKEAVEKHNELRVRNQCKEIRERINAALANTALDTARADAAKQTLGAIPSEDSREGQQLSEIRDELAALETEVNSIPEALSVPSAIEVEIRHRISNYQHAGTIPYQGVNYTFEWDRGSNTLNVKSDQSGATATYSDFFQGQFSPAPAADTTEAPADAPAPADTDSSEPFPMASADVRPGSARVDLAAPPQEKKEKA